MPKFELEEKDHNAVGKATFDKESDYMVIVLNDDVLKKPELVHKIHGQKLIDKKVATKAKEGVKVQERETEQIVNVEKVQK